MPIRKDIMGIAGKASASPKIKADFFYSGEMYVPGEEKKKENETIPVEDWRTVVNRSFMKGLTGDEIRQVFRNKGKKLTDEMNAYINKYEGLIGTVFVDSHVIEQGFPMTDIPKKFSPYHRFAINCDDVVMKSTSHVEGGFSGELESFLDKAANIVTKVVETCRVTGLPVLRKGMFNDKIIDGLLKVLGAEGHGQKALQDALKEKVLGIRKTEEPQAVESDNEGKNVLKYRLKEASFKVPVQIFEEKRYDVDMPLANMPNVDIQAPAEELKVDNGEAELKVDLDPKVYFNTEGNYNLKSPELNIVVNAPSQGLQVSFSAPENKKDISYIHPLAEKDDVVLDDLLRWQKSPK